MFVKYEYFPCDVICSYPMFVNKYFSCDAIYFYGFVLINLVCKKIYDKFTTNLHRMEENVKLNQNIRVKL